MSVADGDIAIAGAGVAMGFADGVSGKTDRAVASVAMVGDGVLVGAKVIADVAVPVGVAETVGITAVAGVAAATSSRALAAPSAA